MSGQASTAQAVRASGAAAPARPLSLPPRPRRVSGPARRVLKDRPVQRRSEEHAGIARGVLSRLEALSRRRALGGRTWIGLVAFALIGIVTLQLGLLKLNAGIGRALEHEAALQRENAALSIENSELGTSARITPWAAQRGMEPVPMGELRFLAIRPGVDVRRGAAALSASAAAAGSGEATGTGSSQAASGSSASTAEPAASTSTSAEGQGSESPSTATEPAASSSGPASSSDESSPGASTEAQTSPQESAPAPASGAPASEAPASGSTEGAPGGGTRASPSG